MRALVAAIADEAVRDLRAGLKFYWPTEKNNDMSEGHVVGALGRALGRLGFYVFHEVQCRTQSCVGHVDLVAMCARRSICIGLEGKRLYDGRGASYLLNDWRRLAKTRLASEYGRPVLNKQVRMLVTSSWQKNIQQWWMGGSEVPARRRHPSWSQLRAEMRGATLDGRLIQADRKSSWEEQWLLFAWAERRQSFFQ